MLRRPHRREIRISDFTDAWHQCNLKPASMRGVKSFAMLLCASSKAGKEEGGVEFVLPPEGSTAGERVYFEGEKYESESKPLANGRELVADILLDAHPEAQLNPKKKIFETIQPVSDF